MQFGEFFWDGDKRIIYEAPSTNFTFTTDVNGYRIYTPIDLQLAPFEVTYDLRADLWSRYVDYMDAIEWATQAFSKSGGASRGTDDQGNETFATADFKSINGWRIVPADYEHSVLILGNFLADVEYHTVDFPVTYPLLDMWDPSRLTENVYMNIRGADSFQNYVINNALGYEADAPTWNTSVGITDAYQSGDSINVRWGYASDLSGDVEYTIYVSRYMSTVYEPHNRVFTVDGNLINLNYEDAGSTPLEDGVTYYIGVRSIDIYNNETTNTNYASVTYSASGISDTNVNIVSVAGTTVTSVDDFKADTVNVDLSGIPADVWSYVTRELTVAAGLTPVQEAKLDQILTDVNSTLDANILSVTGTPVISVDDFKAVDTIVDYAAIAEEILNTDIHAYNDPYTIGSVLHRIDYIGAKIYVDTNALVNGHGSQKMPFDNVNDAKDYAELNGIRDIVVTGNIVVPSNLKNMTVWGIGLPTIDFNGQDVKNSRFNECVLSGTYSSGIIAEKCVITDGFEIEGWFDTCAFVGEFIARGNGNATLVECLSGIPGIGRPVLNMNSGLPSSIGVRGWRGGLDVTNCDDVNDVITVEVAEGSFRFTSTCTAGEMVARGTCKFVDETQGATVYDETSYKENISKTVWAETVRSLTEDVTLDQTSINSIVNGVPQLAEMRAEMVNVQFGKLEITNNQMLVWDQSGTLLVTYDLFDAQGLPTMNQVYRREIV